MRFTKTVLENGVRIITVPMPENPAVTVLVMVEAGSNYESRELSGISHFLEHMVFKGTTRRPQASDISRELDSLGADYNAFTGHEYTGYYAKVDARHFGTALDIVSDMYLDPLLDEGEIEKEKGVVIEEIRMYNDQPQSKVHDTFMELLYEGQPAGRPVTGDIEDVRSFARERLATYRATHYVGAATTVVVAGGIDEASVLEKLAKAWEPISVGPHEGKLQIVESQRSPQVRAATKDTDQTHLVLGFRSLKATDPRIPVMTVLSTVLGHGMSSRLFSKMREDLGICYYIDAGHHSYTDHGFLSVSAGLDATRVEQGIRGILDECARLRSETVPEAELRKAKDYIAGTTMLSLETSSAVAEFYGYQETVKHEALTATEMVARARAVTAEQIRELAGQIFTNSGLNLSIIGRGLEASAIEPYFRLDP